MRRRALLAGVGTAVAGCIESRSPDDGPEPPETATVTPCGTPLATDADATDAPPDAEYVLSDLSVTANHDRPDHRFVLEPSAFYSADAVADEAEGTGEDPVVVHISDVADEDARAAIRTAVRDGSWQSDPLPDSLAETVERADFFTGVTSDDTYTHVGLTLYRFAPEAPPHVGIGAASADPYVAPGDPGAVVFALWNRRSEPREVFSGTVPPFGMLHAASTDGAVRFLLWRDYEEEGCFSRREDGWLSCDIGEITELPPCEHVSRRYEVLTGTTDHYPEETVPPAPGTYRVADGVSYSRGDGAPSSQLSFEVEFELETP